MGLTLALGLTFTYSDTLAPSNLSTSASGASRLANSAESAKFRMYSSLIPSFHFSSLCVEILQWVFGDHVCTLISEVNRFPGNRKVW